MSEPLFTPMQLGGLTAKNRLVRSATYEGMANPDGVPQPALGELYAKLAEGGVGTLITGFTSVSQCGRAMQPAQCGIDTDEKQRAWAGVVRKAKSVGTDLLLIMQLAHAGRQTLEKVTGEPVVGASTRRSSYFRQRVKALKTSEVGVILDQFVEASSRAKAAGFDGVQLHAAHGYLLHQFLSPLTNDRRDEWGDRHALITAIARAVRARCGEGFAIIVKLSAEGDPGGVDLKGTVETAKHLSQGGIDAIEVSTGTMTYALNIMRGDCPTKAVFRVNPLYREMRSFRRLLWRLFFTRAYKNRLFPFEENYNVAAAAVIKREAGLPTLAVGGVRSVAGMLHAVKDCGLDGVSMCRPLIRDPDLPRRIRSGHAQRSECTNCNLCTIYADSNESLRCRGVGDKNS